MIDDIHDAPEDAARWPSLAPKLELCRTLIAPLFDKADLAAQRHQRRHRELVKVAAICGNAAIIFAVVQLAFPGPEMARAELVVAVLAAVAVTLGAIAAFQMRWLVERHKAERLRLAKYRFLIDPALWCGDAEEERRRVKALEDEVAHIGAMNARRLHHWVENDGGFEPPPDYENCRHGKEATDELLDYYRERRLRFQREWFEKRAGENQRIGKYLRHVAPVLFFASVAAVLAHFGHDLLSHEEEGLSATSRWLIVIAASLPVVGEAVRTIQSDYNFNRNTIRYRAKAVALKTIDKALEHYPNARARHTGLWYSELVLESEHREWLRLMIEADWI